MNYAERHWKPSRNRDIIEPPCELSHLRRAAHGCSIQPSMEIFDRLKDEKKVLQKAAGVSANVMARLSKDEYVSMESIEKICAALSCGVDDILEFTSYQDTNSTQSTEI